jgi:hypothetical protein
MVRWRDLQKLEGDVADVLHAKGSAVAAEHFREVVAQQLERHADVPLPFRIVQYFDCFRVDHSGLMWSLFDSWSFIWSFFF